MVTGAYGKNDCFHSFILGLSLFVAGITEVGHDVKVILVTVITDFSMGEKACPIATGEF
jgi:hypothetical protein